MAEMNNEELITKLARVAGKKAKIEPELYGSADCATTTGLVFS